MKLYEINTIRTNNFNDAQVLEKFGQLWQDTLAKYDGQSTLYGVYHEYQSNYQGDYTCSTASDKENGGRNIVLSDAKYKIFHCHKDDVAKTWQDIWALEEKGELHRVYQMDYEKYLADGQVEIYIGIIA
ncbi:MULTISPECIES: GyrI-like domain-containing protein [unclassified Acinetobacter]|uniref:GyrI-like domain-containing protein n=1 Tax=unclassified Acinetobacter TaxID=196816 RepID=UPI0035B8E18B